MFKSIGVPELLLILVILILFFGVGKLPQVGSSIGKAIHSFRQAQNGNDEEETAVETPEKNAAVSNAEKKA